MKARKPEVFGRVAVLMGGWSAEREISLRGGKAVLEALRAKGVDAVGVDVDRNIDQTLRAGRFDRVFNLLHGPGGEDGVIQGLLDILALPYTGSGVAASALTMDKAMTKRVWQSAGLPTPPFRELGPDSDWHGVVAALGLPLIVKPACEGSSIGMSKVMTLEALPAAWEKAARTGHPVFAEKWIRGGEYTVAIVGNQALPLIKVETPRSFYDFEAKYSSDHTQYLCPCGLDYVEEDVLQKLSLEAFRLLGCTGWGRVDLMLDKNNQPWLIEVNTVPGMTSHSLVPKAAAAIGVDFATLVLHILELTLSDSMPMDTDNGEALRHAG